MKSLRVRVSASGWLIVGYIELCRLKLSDKVGKLDADWVLLEGFCAL